MTFSLYEMTSPEVQHHLKSRPFAVIPIGSVEQHGPHLPCGTDTMAAELVSAELANRLQALYVPFSPYGVTPLHAGHPGTISIRRSTFENLLVDVCSELVGMGAEVMILVNWHEINTPSIDTVAMNLQSTTDSRFYVAQACYVAQDLYRERGGSLTHGGGIEALAVLARNPALVKLDKADQSKSSAGSNRADKMRRGSDVYGFVTDVSEIAEDGWYGDPGWATREIAADFAQEVATAIQYRLEDIGALKESE